VPLLAATGQRCWTTPCALPRAVSCAPGCCGFDC
jgi:hypothetical protein